MAIASTAAFIDTVPVAGQYDGVLQENAIRLADSVEVKECSVIVCKAMASTLREQPGILPL